MVGVLLVTLVGSLALGKPWRRGYRRSRDRNPANIADRRGVPKWDMDEAFNKDVFTFVRIRYPAWRGNSWRVDYPDSDLNFSYRLQELTSLKVHPDGKVLELTEPEIFDYPFLYMIEPGSMDLTQPQIEALRRYLLSGGFLMVDDFWGEAEWENFLYQIRLVFPNRDPQELSIDHPIFHCVYDLQEKPQVPSIRGANWRSGQTWERWDAQEVHFKALYDDSGRMMAIICHNTDLGDGWEREGEDEDYFHEFSEKKAYPMGINIIFWAMTH